MEESLLAKIREQLGDAWSDDLTALVDESHMTEVEAAIARETDSLRAGALAAGKEAKSAAAEAKRLAAELAAAGKDTDEALEVARREAAEARAEVERMRADARARDVRDAALAALSGSELPEERRGVAMRSLDLSGVDVDDSGAVVGLSAAVEALRKTEPWLWEQAKRSGNGGPPAGADPAAKPPKPSEQKPGELGERLGRLRTNQRRARMGLTPLEG